jgi:hypothetical protein
VIEISDIPRVHIFHRRENLLPTRNFLPEEFLQIQEVFGNDVILELSKPALMKCVNLQFQQFLLFICKFGDPGFLVEFGGGLRCFACACSSWYCFGFTEEGGDAVIRQDGIGRSWRLGLRILLCLFGGIRCQVYGFAFERHDYNEYGLRWL